MVLLAHPSLSGLNSGTGTSGSTAWNNSVRPRLYLVRIAEEGFERYSKARVLKMMKSNYGPTGGKIGLTWKEGVFEADALPQGLDAVTRNAKAERVLLNLLDTHAAQGRNVSASPSSTFAPSVFAKMPKAEGCTKRVLTAAMEALLEHGDIVLKTSGPASKQRRYLARKGGETDAV